MPRQTKENKRDMALAAHLFNAAASTEVYGKGKDIPRWMAANDATRCQMFAIAKAAREFIAKEIMEIKQ